MPLVYAALAAAGLLTASGTLGDVAGVMYAFFTTITNGKMWRSLGWLALGLALAAFGMKLWLRVPLASVYEGE